METDTGFSRLELRLSNCLHNYRYFRSKLEQRTRMLVLVKANAYGHGAVEFAAMMQRAGADYLAVATPVEGVELRRNGISLPILVLTAGADFFHEIVENRLEPGVPNLAALERLCEVLKEKGIKDYPIHIKLDTGMHRLGFMTSELQGLCQDLAGCPWVRVKSLYSHLAAAEDPAQDAFTEGQVSMFRANAATVTKSLGYKPMWHILNSAGIERFPQYQFDMVRLGIGVYGISALPGKRLSPVAFLKCKILQLKRLAPSDGTIGYGRHGMVRPEGSVIATIPVGYADGIDRHLGCGHASFSLRGMRVPTVGNICMDMCMLDVTDVHDVAVGDEVTIFGDDPTATELADILGTIPYEIMTSVPRRIPRVVVR